MRRFAGLFVLAVVSLSPALGVAQVNTEKLRSWETDGFNGSLDFSLTHRSGNVSLLLAGTSVRAQWARLKPKTSTASADRLEDLVYFIGDLSIGIRTGERFKNAGFGHLRWTHMWSSFVGSELYGQVQYNEFIRLQRRLLGGLGARLELLEGEKGEVVIGTGYMLEFEQNDVPLDGPDEKRVLAHRWTSYLSLKGYLKHPNVTVVETIYAQPRLTDFGDYRILNEAELSVAVTDNLSLVAGLYLRYDSQPVAEVERLDLTIMNKLRLTL